MNSTFSDILFYALTAGIFGGAAHLLVELYYWSLDEKPRPRWPYTIAMVLSLQAGRLLANTPVHYQFQDIVDPSGKFKRDLQRQLEPTLSRPEIATLFHGKSAAEKTALGMQLGINGVHKLPTNYLLKWHAIRTKLMNTSPKFCSAFWTGAMDEDAVFQTLGALSSEDQASYIEIVRLATIAGAQPLDPELTNQENLWTFFDPIHDSLKDDNKKRFEANMENGDKLSVEEACWMVKTIFHYLDSGQDENREWSLRRFGSIGAKPF